MDGFKEYRCMSPILVGEDVTYIIELPSQECPGYRVSGQSVRLQEDQFSPIPIDDTVYKVFKHHEQFGTLQFENSEHKVSLDRENNFCYIDGEPFGIVDNVHELNNIIEDSLGIHMTYYLPPLNHNRSCL